MGSVSKVEKRSSAIGGSARQTYVQRERWHGLCFGGGNWLEKCHLGFCLPKEKCATNDPFLSQDCSRKDDDDDDDEDDVGSNSRNGKKNNKNAVVDMPASDSNGNNDNNNNNENRSGDKNNKDRRKQRIQQYASHAKSSSLITYQHKAVTYALKSIHLDRCRDAVFKQELLNEIAILQNLDHPHIVKAIETFDYRHRLYLVLELCSGGDLYSRDPYTESQACQIVHAILDAVAYMHSRGITHRDLKFENIMFSSPTSDTVKVIDFGLSKKYSQQQHLHDTVGTVYTMAPEVLKGDYDNKCDVWSIGVLTFMLLSSSLPFYGKSRSQVVRKVLHGKYGFKGHRWKTISPTAKEFVMDCLVQRASKRKSADQMLQHAFIKRAIDAELASVNFELMDRVQASIQTFGSYKRLKKLALLVIAYKSTDEDIGCLQHVFNCFDTVRDGEITLEEFKQALAVYHYDETDLERMFLGMDLDGTGKVHYTEFLAATLESHGAIAEENIAEAFDRLDSDDSGYITVKNIRSFLGNSISYDYANAIIEEVGVRHDHRISYQEFLGLWDESSDHQHFHALQDVNFRRTFSEDHSTDDNDPSTDVSVASSSDELPFTTAGVAVNSQNPAAMSGSSSGGNGSLFFGLEKEKSMRGVWV